MSKHTTWTGLGLVAVSIALVVAYSPVQAGPPAMDPGMREEEPKAVVVAVKVKPDIEGLGERPAPKVLSSHTDRGLAYVVNQQHASGGWSQGGGWRQAGNGGRIQGNQVTQERPDVGNTAIATLALVRAGHTPSAGRYAEAVRRGVDFICRSVEASDDESLWITDVRDTQLQLKIGSYVDTFLTATLLPELKGTMPDEAGEGRLLDCVNTVIGKIERHQREDGTFTGNRGWASVLSQSLSVRGLNKAKRVGIPVEEVVLARAQDSASSNYDVARDEFKGAAGAEAASDAGVSLYQAGAVIGGLYDSVATGEQGEKEAMAVVEDPEASPSSKEEAQRKLDRLRVARDTQGLAKQALVRELADVRFVSGFGSNGGEEFLSYMNISESLLRDGGPEWEAWDAKMTANLNRNQNADGSWSGHHCITGRIFVTSTALLVLMADRAPIEGPVEMPSG